MKFVEMNSNIKYQVSHWYMSLQKKGRIPLMKHKEMWCAPVEFSDERIISSLIELPGTVFSARV